MARWGVYLPAILSAVILICQTANTFIFGSFAYNFGELYVLLDEYMNRTAALNLSLPNGTGPFKYDGANFDRLNQVDLYHDQLWTLFVAEVIELVFPVINLFMFAWIIQDKRRHRLGARLQAVYLVSAESPRASLGRSSRPRWRWCSASRRRSPSTWPCSTPCSRSASCWPSCWPSCWS